MRSLVLSALLLLSFSAPAEESRMPVPGDCAAFREGGAGYILTAPTYYVLGTITEIYRRPHHMGLCPDAGKRREQFTRVDWLRLAEAYPCVGDPARVRDVDVIRVRMRVDKWETPWSASQGRIGMLFRGNHLDVELKEGVVLDIDGTLLERCEKD